jgi:Raf kinase inhibitor-like YbhB/YbcL family protein
MVTSSFMFGNHRFYASRLAVFAWAVVMFASIRLAAIELPGPDGAIAEGGANSMSFAISSSSFSPSGEIPKKFTCDDADVSPELSWTGAPAGVQSFALIADDPDAPVGTWTHWVLFNLPAQTTELSEGVSKLDELPGGGRQGRNDFHKIGYGGPCPPPGKPHRYFFKLYALDQMLSLKPGAGKKDLEEAMQEHILGKAELMGKYQRSK